jgi:chloramphenicol 3-O-phosphotransferase
MVKEIPLCVVINGPSAAGKSTLAAAIQDHFEVPLLRFGVDELYRMVPDQWAGGVRNARHADRGFTYQTVPDRPGVRRINNGVDAIAMLYAMNSAIAGILVSGMGVVVDGQAFEPQVNSDLEKRLRDLQAEGLAQVAMIELVASDEQLAERQRQHAHPVGLSLYHSSLPKQAGQPDLVVDTTEMDVAHVAKFVCDWLDRQYLGRLQDPHL